MSQTCECATARMTNVDRILAAISSAPLTALEIANETGIPASALSITLGIMLAVEQVQRQKVGGRSVYLIPAKVAA
jgi:DNA-binding transcriptional regulator GbsR (MarR family)